MKILLSTLLVLVACSDHPTATGAVCPDPDPGTLTYENFGKPFMDKYCTWCHDSSLPRSQRNGAPLFHDFDSLLGVLEVQGHIDQQTGIGPDASNHFMPPDRCPATIGGALSVDCEKPTDDERRNLSIWLACEKDRPHDFSADAGVDAQ
jgi:hypothetical protein